MSVIVKDVKEIDVDLGVFSTRVKIKDGILNSFVLVFHKGARIETIELQPSEACDLKLVVKETVLEIEKWIE